MKVSGRIPTGRRPVTRSRMPSRATWCWPSGSTRSSSQPIAPAIRTLLAIWRPTPACGGSRPSRPRRATPAPGTFTITRLQSPAGLPDRITKLSPVPALLVSISLKSLPSSSYQVWAADKLLATSIVHPFRSNVIDFDSQPRCWAGCAFDYVHYSVPRNGLDDIAEDLGVGRVNDYSLAVLEDDLVVAQITKSTLPFLGRSDAPS